MKNCYFIIGLIIALASSVPASAATCVAGSVQSILGTTCSIGDVNFIFNSSASSDSTLNGVSNPTSASDVMFTPNPTPLNPGFTWSGNFALNSASGPFPGTLGLLRFQLLLGIQPLPSDTAIVAVSTAINGVSASPGNENLAYASSSNSNWPGSPIASTYVGYNGSVRSISSSSIPVAPFWGVACCGLVQFLAETIDGGSVS